MFLCALNLSDPPDGSGKHFSSLVDYLDGFGRTAARAAAETDGHASLDGEAHVLDHLSRAHLDNKQGMALVGALADDVRWIRPQRDGPNETHLKAFRARRAHRIQADPGGGSVGDEDDLDILQVDLLVSDLLLLDLSIFGLQLFIVFGEVALFEEERLDNV